MKPVIGITPAYDLEKGRGYIKSGYYKSVQRAGGVAVILPEAASWECLGDLAEACDGFIFTGGQDFGGRYYREKLHPKTGRPAPVRDELEFALMDILLKKNKPILGICRGAQLITLATGGSLWQDIPSQIGSGIDHEMCEPYDRFAHNIIIEESSPLFGVIGKREMWVNSCHHQAVGRCGAGQEVMAYSPDGVIEATYMPQKRFVWGVQWHPELMTVWDKNAIKIFEALIGAAELK